MSSSSSSSSSSSNNILPLASTFLLLLLLIPSLQLLINGLNSLPTLLTCLFFKAPLCVLISFLKGLKLSSQALLTAFKALAEAFKGTLVYIIEMVLGMLGSLFMALLEFVKNISVAESAFGGLLEKTKASWGGSNLMEQLREIAKKVFEIIFDQLLETATSSAGGLFEFAKATLSTLLSEPGSTIGGLVEMMKGLLEGSSSATKGVRGIVGSIVEKVARTGLGGVASSSVVGSFEILKFIFGLMVESGYSVGGLMEKTKAALEVLRMEEVRGIVESIGKLLVNMIISYFLPN